MNKALASVAIRTGKSIMNLIASQIINDLSSKEANPISRSPISLFEMTEKDANIMKK